MIFISLILFFLNFLIILNIENLANFVQIFDKPDKKLKLHKHKVPILGGIIFMINLIIFSIYQILFLNKFLFLEIGLYKTQEIFGFLFLIISFFLIGLYDDKYNLKPSKKFFYSIVIISIFLSLNPSSKVTMFSVSFYDYKIFLDNFSLIFTVFCFLILVNALNFYDGINGQSCIFFIIIFSFLFFKSEMKEFYLFSIFSLFVILFLNLRNKLFFGDNGVLLLSVIIALSLIFEHNIEQNIYFVDEIFFLLLLPGIDLVRLTIVRIFNGQNAFYGDRNHIHHLINKRLSITNTNILLFVLSVTPITLFLYFKINFYYVFIIFVFIYISSILIFKSNDKKYYYRKK